MLSPEAFRTEYSDEALAAELPDSPVGSLRDIQYLYGKLYTLATTGGGEYAPYLTPDAAGDLIDTDDSLVVVRVDLSAEQPQLADDDRGPVHVTRYTDDLVTEVAHCKYAAARGIDHSVTHQAGRNSDPEKLARYAKERLTKWAVDDVVQDAAAEHDSGWIIDGLATLGENEESLDRIETELTDALDGESATALLTVQVSLDGEEYLWPGQRDVFLSAMRERKLSKLVTKNKANDSSGEAIDIVTGAQTRTVGTADDPQNHFLGKQREKFPGLDVEQAWRSHPISEDSAVTVMNADAFTDACSFYALGAKVFYLPYPFGTITPEDARNLYRLLYDTLDDDGLNPVEAAYTKERGGDDVFEDAELRFYVSAVLAHQTSRYDVVGETLNGRLFYPRQLALAHNAVAETEPFTDDEWTAPLPTSENWALLAGSDDQLDSVTTGWYFTQTFAEHDDDEAAEDDPRIDALVAVLSGESIAVEQLLDEYTDRITADADDDDRDGFPVFRVASQFAQLCALADDELDLLSTTDDAKEPITREPTYETPPMETVEAILPDGGNPGESKLESFIEQTPAIAPSDDDDTTDQRRGAFLLGALVGAVGNYQGYDLGRSTTLIDQFPVKSITRTRIKKVTQEAIGKTVTYTREESRTVTKFDHIVERLRRTVLNPEPDEWVLDTDDLRFYYALGVTYGMNDRATSNETDEET